MPGEVPAEYRPQVLETKIARGTTIITWNKDENAPADGEEGATWVKATVRLDSPRLQRSLREAGL